MSSNLCATEVPERRHPSAFLVLPTDGGQVSSWSSSSTEVET